LSDNLILIELPMFDEITSPAKLISKAREDRRPTQQKPLHVSPPTHSRLTVHNGGANYPYLRTFMPTPYLASPTASRSLTTRYSLFQANLLSRTTSSSLPLFSHSLFTSVFYYSIPA